VANRRAQSAPHQISMVLEATLIKSEFQAGEN
jgi:hypothetical protein